jgi:hypothetical protein
MMKAAETSEELLGRVVAALAPVRGVCALVLGGSRGRGTYDELSDYDIGLYYRGTQGLDFDELDRAAASLDDMGAAAAMTRFGGWGPWVNGGGWLRVGGVPVDILYRDIERVGRVIEDCQLSTYPERLKDALVTRFLDEARFFLGIAVSPLARVRPSARLLPIGRRRHVMKDSPTVVHAARPRARLLPLKERPARREGGEDLGRYVISSVFTMRIGAHDLEESGRLRKDNTPDVARAGYAAAPLRLVDLDVKIGQVRRSQDELARGVFPGHPLVTTLFTLKVLAVIHHPP